MRVEVVASESKGGWRVRVKEDRVRVKEDRE